MILSTALSNSQFSSVLFNTSSCFSILEIFFHHEKLKNGFHQYVSSATRMGVKVQSALNGSKTKHLWIDKSEHVLECTGVHYDTKTTK